MKGKNKIDTIKLLLLSLFLVLIFNTTYGYYFFDDFENGNHLTVSGFSDWSVKFFSRGGEDDPNTGTDFKSESGGKLILSGTRNRNGAWMGDGIMRGPFNAKAEAPFGAQIDLENFTGNGTDRTEIEFTLFKSTTEFASLILYHNNDGNYYIGYAWRDGLTEAPSLSYPTDIYSNIGASFGGSKTLKVTHDGSQIKFFVNDNEVPSPYDGSEALVDWNTNLYLIITGAGKDNPSTITTSTLDNCLIRSPVSSSTTSKAEIYPNKVTINGNDIAFNYYILPTFDAATDSGIDEITITMPSGFSDLNVTGVQSDYDSNGSLDTLSLTGGVPGASQYSTTISGNKITIRLGTKISFSTSNKEIIVSFTADTPATTSFYGDTVIGTLEGKHDATSTNNCTTGPAQVESGNADGSITSDSILISVFNTPQVEIAIDPYTIGQDAATTVFSYNVRNASLLGNDGITKIRIDIPTGFTVQTVDSVLLTSAEETTAITINTTNITVDYGSVSKNLPANGGTDILTITAVDSINTPGGPYFFTSVVDDEVEPVGWIATTVQSGATNGVMVTPVQASGSAYIGPNTIFTSVSNTEFSYTIVNNGSGGNNITEARITIPTGFTITDVTNINSSLIGTNVTISNNVIILDYITNGATFAPSQLDTITLNVEDTITNPTYQIKWTATIDNGNGYFPAVSDAGLSVNVIDSTNGSLSGKILPINVLATVKVVSNGTIFKTVNTDGVTGFYQVNELTPGTYDIIAGASGYAEGQYLSSITIVANQNTSVSNIILQQNALDSESTATQTRNYLYDTLTKLEFPAGTLNKDAYVVISKITNLSTEQINNLNNNSKIVPPSVTTSFDAFSISIQDSANNNLEDLAMKGEISFTIHYDQTEILAKGWTEDNLSVYFWDNVKWIKVGGVVNSSSDLITLKIRNLKGTYAVFGSTTTKGAIRDVTVSPNPFTPNGSSFNIATLSFTLDKSYTSVKVRIFNLRGRMVRKYTIDGTSQNGSVPWDGKDKDGYYVKSGLYIYQISAGSNTYTGKILMIK